MRIYHDSQSLQCRDPQGAAPCQMMITLRLQADEEARSASLRFYDGSEKWFPMEKEKEGWFAVRVQMPQIPILCWYDFQLEDYDGNIISYAGPHDGMGGEGHICPKPRAWQITVYDPAFDTPHWMREGAMYQIFPDRFRKSGEKHPRREECYYHENWEDDPILMPEGEDDNCARDFFEGDLKGIEEKLPYLADMGITVLYLNPIFQARSNHRYDTGDYLKIDSHLGSREDFISLCEKAKDHGIRLMLDGVFSHTGEDSIYFNRFGRYPSVGACQSTQSPYYPWYRFIQYPGQYECWWGFHTLPAMDKDNESYREFALGEQGVVRHWVKEGAAGWRLDVADELPMSFLRQLRTAVKTQDPDAVVLGEVWEDASNKETYGEMRCYCQGDTLDSVMNYPLRAAALDFFTRRSGARSLKRLIDSQKENYPKAFHYSLMNLAGSHDRPRAINELCCCTWEELPPAERGKMRLSPENYQLGLSRYIQMMRLLCALPGIPCVYYGDEAGMQGGSDPYCRGTFPWGKENQQLQKQIKDMLWQRRNSPAMQTGDLTVEAPDDDTIVIIREIKGGKDVFGTPAADERVEITIRR
ncbi:MAG: glycoside hydrolase family 13 protein [Clostridiales bacterium]|nr:glycoside hydrolase family 13 protein [Clostridiales bacterium]